MADGLEIVVGGGNGRSNSVILTFDLNLKRSLGFVLKWQKNSSGTASQWQGILARILKDNQVSGGMCWNRKSAYANAWIHEVASITNGTYTYTGLTNFDPGDDADIYMGIYLTKYGTNNYPQMNCEYGPWGSTTYSQIKSASTYLTSINWSESQDYKIELEFTGSDDITFTALLKEIQILPAHGRN